MQKKSKYPTTHSVSYLLCALHTNENFILCLVNLCTTTTQRFAANRMKSIHSIPDSSCAYLQFTYLVNVLLGKKTRKECNLVSNFQICRRGQMGINGHWPTVSSLLCCAPATHPISITIDRTFALHTSSPPGPVLTVRSDTRPGQRVLLRMEFLNAWTSHLSKHTYASIQSNTAAAVKLKQMLRYYLTSENVETRKEKMGTNCWTSSMPCIFCWFEFTGVAFSIFPFRSLCSCAIRFDFHLVAYVWPFAPTNCAALFAVRPSRPQPKLCVLSLFFALHFIGMFSSVLSIW